MSKRSDRNSAAKTDFLPSPPHCFEAEDGVLSSLLQGADPSSALQELIPGDFFSPLNRRAFARMKYLFDAQQPVNLVSLSESMHLDGVETAQIAKLLDPLLLVRSPNDLASHVRIVKKHSQHRMMLSACEATIQARNGDAPELARQLKEKILRYLASLEQGQTSEVSEPPDWRGMFHTFTDFENSGDLTFAIAGFLQNNGATMLGGLSGHGKTLMLLSIVKALLAGKGARLWDLFTVEETTLRVLYLIPECSIQPFKHRLKLFGLYDYLAPADERLLVRTLSKGATPCLSDPKILFAAKGTHVVLDTAARFGEGDENSASDNQRGLASDIFALLGSGARTVIAAHHSPKPFARDNVMRLENVLRGSGDVGAMLSTAWGIKQLDAAQNMIHVENVKPRDFQPCQPFQLIGRPFIDEAGDFRLYKKPGECGSLMEEQQPERDQGGAPLESRRERERRIAMCKKWLADDAEQSVEELRQQFAKAGVTLSRSAVKNYRREAQGE
jgi:DnaB helicase-like protein/AAA domain-containing protein